MQQAVQKMNFVCTLSLCVTLCEIRQYEAFIKDVSSVTRLRSVMDKHIWSRRLDVKVAGLDPPAAGQLPLFFSMSEWPEWIWSRDNLHGDFDVKARSFRHGTSSAVTTSSASQKWYSKNRPLMFPSRSVFTADADTKYQCEWRISSRPLVVNIWTTNYFWSDG